MTKKTTEEQAKQILEDTKKEFQSALNELRSDLEKIKADELRQEISEK